MKNVKFKCADCGSSNIQVKAWVNMNTNEYKSDVNDYEVWCDDCKNNVDFIDETEPEKVIKLYTVKLERFISTTTVQIEALSEEHAISIAETMYDKGEISLFDNVDFEVTDVNDINY